jgi:hypothetical protein
MQIRIGEPTVIEAIPEGNRYGVVFEDDGETGYLYALDQTQQDMSIVDAMLIYGVSEASRGNEVTLKILWNTDKTGATLLADGAPQAVVDFARSQACCRSGFPRALQQGWSLSHDWDEAVFWRVNSDGI